MDVKRKVAMAVATLTVALGAGHLMQNGLGLGGAQVALADMPAPTPEAIMPLAAGLGPLGDTVVGPDAPVPPLPDAAFDPVRADPSPPGRTTKNEACPVTLEVMASAQATLDLTLIAPCRASERVVLRHGGLAITAMTSITGTLFTSLPGMEAAGEVSIFFDDGIGAQATQPLPDMPLYRRFAVQWVAEDRFQLHAFENGAAYGAEGHVFAAKPQRRLPNVVMQGGYLTLLGDSTAPLPMQAEVYTFPLDDADQVDLSVEAAVTQATCDREMLGEVLLSEGGGVTKTDLTMATPACDAIGDILVLNNPLSDLKLAVAN
jgi:hypothetical protein